MASQDVGNALRAMADDNVRAQVAEGNFEAIDEAGLTDEEREMLVGAAEDYPEASGFAFEGSIKWSPSQTPDLSSMGRFGTALQYSGIIVQDETLGGHVM